MQIEPTNKTVNTGVKLDADLYIRLKALGEVKDRSPHWLMKAAIARYVEAEEEYEREKQKDLVRWQRYKKTGKAVPCEDVESFLTSWGDAPARPK